MNIERIQTSLIYNMFTRKLLALLCVYSPLSMCKPVNTSTAKTVITGEKISLSCDLVKQEESIVLWKKDERVIFAGDLRVRMDERLSVDDGDFEIFDITMDDSGEYKCEIESANGELSFMSYVVKTLKQSEATIQVGSQLTVKAGTRLVVLVSVSVCYI